MEGNAELPPQTVPLAFVDNGSGVFAPIAPSLSQPFTRLVWEMPNERRYEIQSFDVQFEPFDRRSIINMRREMNHWRQPFLTLYIFTCQTVSAYDEAARRLSAWATTMKELHLPWLIVHVPLGKGKASANKKIFNMLRRDFYAQTTEKCFYLALFDQAEKEFAEGQLRELRHAMAAEVLRGLSTRVAFHRFETREFEVKRVRKDWDPRACFLLYDGLSRVYEMFGLYTEALHCSEAGLAHVRETILNQPLPSVEDVAAAAVSARRRSSVSGAEMLRMCTPQIPGLQCQPYLHYMAPSSDIAAAGEGKEEREGSHGTPLEPSNGHRRLSTGRNHHPRGKQLKRLAILRNLAHLINPHKHSLDLDSVPYRTHILTGACTPLSILSFGFARECRLLLDLRQPGEIAIRAKDVLDVVSDLLYSQLAAGVISRVEVKEHLYATAMDLFDVCQAEADLDIDLEHDIDMVAGGLSHLPQPGVNASQVTSAGSEMEEVGVGSVAAGMSYRGGDVALPPPLPSSSSLPKDTSLQRGSSGEGNVSSLSGAGAGAGAGAGSGAEGGEVGGNSGAGISVSLGGATGLPMPPKYFRRQSSDRHSSLKRRLLFLVLYARRQLTEAYLATWKQTEWQAWLALRRKAVYPADLERTRCETGGADKCPAPARKLTVEQQTAARDIVEGTMKRLEELSEQQLISRNALLFRLALLQKDRALQLDALLVSLASCLLGDAHFGAQLRLERIAILMELGDLERSILLLKDQVQACTESGWKYQSSLALARLCICYRRVGNDTEYIKFGLRLMEPSLRRQALSVMETAYPQDGVVLEPKETLGTGAAQIRRRKQSSSIFPGFNAEDSGSSQEGLSSPTVVDHSSPTASSIWLKFQRLGTEYPTGLQRLQLLFSDITQRCHSLPKPRPPSALTQQIRGIGSEESGEDSSNSSHHKAATLSIGSSPYLKINVSCHALHSSNTRHHLRAGALCKLFVRIENYFPGDLPVDGIQLWFRCQQQQQQQQQQQEASPPCSVNGRRSSAANDTSTSSSARGFLPRHWQKQHLEKVAAQVEDHRFVRLQGNNEFTCSWSTPASLFASQGDCASLGIGKEGSSSGFIIPPGVFTIDTTTTTPTLPPSWPDTVAHAGVLEWRMVEARIMVGQVHLFDRQATFKLHHHTLPPASAPASIPRRLTALPSSVAPTPLGPSSPLTVRSSCASPAFDIGTAAAAAPWETSEGRSATATLPIMHFPITALCNAALYRHSESPQVFVALLRVEAAIEEGLFLRFVQQQGTVVQITAVWAKEEGSGAWTRDACGIAAAASDGFFRSRAEEGEEKGEDASSAEALQGSGNDDAAAWHFIANPNFLGPHTRRPTEYMVFFEISRGTTHVVMQVAEPLRDIYMATSSGYVPSPKAASHTFAVHPSASAAAGNEEGMEGSAEKQLQPLPAVTQPLAHLLFQRNASDVDVVVQVHWAPGGTGRCAQVTAVDLVQVALLHGKKAIEVPPSNVTPFFNGSRFPVAAGTRFVLRGQLPRSLVKALQPRDKDKDKEKGSEPLRDAVPVTVAAQVTLALRYRTEWTSPHDQSETVCIDTDCSLQVTLGSQSGKK